MRTDRWTIALSLALAVLSPLDAAAAGRYLFDVLDDPPHLQAWNELIASRRDADAWLQRYGATRDGVSAPSKAITVHGRTFDIGSVCKRHDCGDNLFYVTFSASGNRAWGLLLKAGAEPSLFGEPDADTASALREAAGID